MPLTSNKKGQVLVRKNKVKCPYCISHSTMFPSFMEITHTYTTFICMLVWSVSISHTRMHCHDDGAKFLLLLYVQCLMKHLHKIVYMCDFQTYTHTHTLFTSTPSINKRVGNLREKVRLNCEVQVLPWRYSG